MKTIISCLFISLLPVFTLAQVNATHFGLSSNFQNIVKTTDFGIVHDYVEIYTNDTFNLDMRWQVKFPSDFPSAWEVNFSDLDSAYDRIYDKDSATFLLPYPTGFNNKLIIGVKHNGVIGESNIKFKIFPIQFPNDSLILTFSVNISPGTNSVNELNLNSRNVYFNTESNRLHFKDIPLNVNCSIFNISGQLIEMFPIKNRLYKTLDNYEKGMYLISLTNNNTLLYSSKFIK